MYQLEITHNAEAAHRFFQASASPKCRSIHGHRWMITLMLRSEKLDDQGMVVEFGHLKRIWRSWLDAHLDHALMLNQADPMAAAIREIEPGSRLFLMSADPTTENIAQLLYEQAQLIVTALDCPSPVQVVGVRVEETQVNAVNYVNSPEG
ncbi:6-carboxytetrahydropterin synthase [Synechococcales cyanobacterium C]|uniref:6-carboxy-5,6,7,8-tetrahydropterin synthase n=1 Tax=Petrachloros mirabilis ULC683 TaxID=2781853 RepID=A0A8K2A0E5_9CYAN|nr:6-carboxytetrahydropterin synthase [Petrachloros mirabilis]NCJ07441.1 6-carboxytetrahydropterin synthase [Petrachloros mirabilis ULC683]